MLVVLFDHRSLCDPLIPQLGDGITPTSLLALIPALSSEISTLLADPPWTPFSEIDARVLAMARWFKSDFMRWVDPIMCPSCGGKTAAAGNVEPSWKQRQDGAGRVELHVCVDGGCGGEKAFARYGKVATLAKTREGRCGE
jgi:peptide-N4-(N-acetyl-beta-glucosaminyl)asparagine amidase